MTAAALIASATIPTLMRLVRTDRAAMAETMTYRALERLAHQFREDIRHAESVTDDDGLVLIIADRQVTYFIDNHALRRKTVRNDQTRTDAFALPSETQFQFAAPRRTSAGLARIRVQLPRRPQRARPDLFADRYRSAGRRRLGPAILGATACGRYDA